jgi:adenylate cyclase class IV
MSKEIESKWLDVDFDELRKRIKLGGGELVQPMTLMKLHVFDSSDHALSRDEAFIRVRDEGDRVTMCYKKFSADTLDGVTEITFDVSDYDKAVEFLVSAGFIIKKTEEKRRETWRLGTAEIALDEWPWLPPLIEVETPSESDQSIVAEKLGLDLKKASHSAVGHFYADVYGIDESDFNNKMRRLGFDEKPALLKSA